MTTGGGVVQYGGRYFPTVIEARWAAFFDAATVSWYHDPQGQEIGNEEYYRPQFELRRLGAFLEVRDPDDPRLVVELLDLHPEIEEHVVYLAVGGPPTERQLRAAGWWDAARRRGVTNLTPGFPFDSWFPVDADHVLAALETAHAVEFESEFPFPRPPGTGSWDQSDKP